MSIRFEIIPMRAIVDSISLVFHSMLIVRLLIVRVSESFLFWPIEKHVPEINDASRNGKALTHRLAKRRKHYDRRCKD